MAKILKQLSNIHDRLFAADPPEKSPPPDLYLDTRHPLAVDVDVYALRRCHSDLSPLYVTRLSVSQEELHSSTLPPPKNLLNSLHVIRERGLGVMQRVRGGGQDLRSRDKTNVVSRSDSFKFQSPAEREDRVIVPPRRRARKKGAAPTMPQLLEDYAAPVDLVNRAKFRQVIRSDTSQLVQVDEDYSDVADSKDYVTPGEDGTRKIYSTHVGDSIEDDTDELVESDLPYCQPYSHTGGIAVSLPCCEDTSLYEEVSQQQLAVAVRLPDPLYSAAPQSTSPSSSTSAIAVPQYAAVRRQRGSTSCTVPAASPAGGVHDHPAPVYENVRLAPSSRAQLVLGRRRRLRAAPPQSSLTRSCEDLRRIVDNADSAIYVNAGDPIVQFERLASAPASSTPTAQGAGNESVVISVAGDEIDDEGQEMSRRLYETAFDSSAPPPTRDVDLLPRLAAMPLPSSGSVSSSSSSVVRGDATSRRQAGLCGAPAAPRRHRPTTATGHTGTDQRGKRSPTGSPSSPVSPVSSTVAERPQIRAEVHASPPATTPLSSKFSRDRRLEFVGLWGSPRRSASQHSAVRPGSDADRRQPPGELHSSRRAGRPHSLCGDQAGTMPHRYECLELPTSEVRTGVTSGKLVCGDHNWDSTPRPASNSGSSTLSSLESLRSGDSDSVGPGDSLSRSHLSAALYRRLASARVPVLSPISDKSQEAESPGDSAPRMVSRGGDCVPQAPSRSRSGLHGSDSGISVDSHGESAAPLPFDMPKLRRKAAATSLALPSQDSSARPGADAVVRPSLSLRLGSSDADRAADPGAAPARAPMALLLGCLSHSAGSPIDLNIPFQEQRWYHGAITRVEAEKILRGQQEGSYLVRTCESSRPDYSLSLKSARGFMHMKIRQDPGSQKYILGQFSKPFDSIPQMIQHYSLTKLPIRGAEHMSLLHPVADDQLL